MQMITILTSWVIVRISELKHVENLEQCQVDSKCCVSALSIASHYGALTLGTADPPGHQRALASRSSQEPLGPTTHCPSDTEHIT